MYVMKKNGGRKNMQNKLVRKELFVGIILLFVWASIILPVNSQQTPDLTGTWSGTLIQYPSSQFQYNLTIKQSGTVVEGESRIQSSDGYGIMKFSGTVSGENLTFTETMIIENHPGPGYYWILKTVSLRWGKGATNQSLNGTWGVVGSENLGTVFLTFVPSNNPPNTPSTPVGSTFLNVGQSGTYSTSTTDPDGDQIQHMFDWDASGTHSYSPLTPLVYSGQPASISHSWDKAGTYVVKAQAYDEHDLKSGWSEGLTIIVNSSSGGLVGYWNFDEGSGNIAADSSGNSNTGTLINNPSWVDGKSGKALSFNGVNNYVQIPDSSSLDVTSQVTLEAWVYARAYVDSVGMNPHIVSRTELSGGVIYMLNIYGSTHKVGYAVNPYPDQQPSESDLPLNTWTHIAMTYDGSRVQFYMNGQPNGGHAQSGPISTTSNWLAIGCTPNGPYGGAGTYAYFNGIIDEVKIYNKALSQQEIQTDMGTISPPSSQKQTPGFTTVATIAAVATAGALVAFFRRRNRNR